MEKVGASGVQLENHVALCITYGIALTAVVCVLSPDIVSITACP